MRSVTVNHSICVPMTLTTSGVVVFKINHGLKRTFLIIIMSQTQRRSLFKTGQTLDDKLRFIDHCNNIVVTEKKKSKRCSISLWDTMILILSKCIFYFWSIVVFF